MIHCPLCNGRWQFHLYENIVTGVPWALCRQCGWQGDLLELLAHRWGLPMEDTLQKAKSLDLFPVQPSSLQRYLDQYQFRQRLSSLLDTGAEYLRQGPGTHVWETLEYYGLDPRDRHRLAEFVPFLRVVTREDLRSLFSESALPGDDPEVVVIPVYSLPGYVCGLWYHGTTQACYLRVPPHPHGYTLSGLIGWQILYDPPHDSTGQTLFVCQDIVAVIHLQARYRRYNTRWLPLVAEYAVPRTDNEPIHTVWEANPHPDVVYGGISLTPRMVNSARQASGRVANYTYRTRSAWYKARTPVAWIELFQRRALPWVQALETMLLRVSVPDAEAVLREMQMTPAEMHDFARRSGHPAVTALIRHLTVEPRGIRRLDFHGSVITETPHGWFLRNTQLSNAVVRVDRLVAYGTTRTQVCGRVLYGGSTYPFRVMHDGLPNDLFATIQAYLREHYQFEIVYSKRWARRSLAIAQLFHPVEIVHVKPTVGWVAEQRTFSFPNFLLTARGEIQDPWMPDHRGPGRLPRPESVSPDVLLALPDTETLACAWAVLAAMAANILAPAIDHDPIGVLLVGDGAQVVGQAVARALDCRTYKKQPPAAWAHAYPWLLQPCRAAYTVALDEILRRPTLCYGVVPVPWIQGHLAGITGRWNLIVADQMLGVLGAAEATWARLCSAYLQDVCRRRFRVQHGAQSLAKNILLDLQEWVARCAGAMAAETVQRGTRYLYGCGDTSRAWHLGLVLADHAQRHRGRAPKRPDTKSVYVDEESQEVWIPHALVARMTARLPSIQLGAEDITQILREEGVLLREARRMLHRWHPFWVIRADWWNQRVVEVQGRKLCGTSTPTA